VNENLSEAKRALLQKKLQEIRSKKSGTTVGIEPRPNDAPPLLSFAQRRLWFLSQWEPESPAYNLNYALRLTGVLDVAVLQRALNEILRRHSILRTTYAEYNDEPFVQLQAEAAISLSQSDLTSLSFEEREAVLVREAAAASARPFDLATELPICAALLRLAEQEHVLLLNLHHIATDGWSMGLFFNEFSQLYTAFSQGLASPLPELSIQYEDFACWQRNWLQGAVLERQVTYWREQLSDAPPVLELPVARPRPPIQTSKGAVQRFTISPETTRAVQVLSQRVNASPFMVLLAAFQTLLGRYANTDDILVGTPIAGRNRVEIEPLIGFFVNTLVLRARLTGDPTGLELLDQVRDTTLAAYDHQDLPFEKLVEELHPERNLSHNPLFQVMFIYHNEPADRLQIPGLQVDFLGVDASAAKFDLKLSLEEHSGKLSGLLSYNTDLFDAATIAQMTTQFATLLAAFTATPEMRISELPLLTPDAQQAWVAQWTDTRTDHRQVHCMHQLFEEQVARTPEALAVVFEEGQYTYRQLNERANQVARYLQTVGVGPDVCVGLYMEKSLDILVALLGILKAGGAYVPLDPLYPPERIRLMMEDLGVQVLVTDTALAAVLPDRASVQTFCVDTDMERVAGFSPANLPLQVTAQNLIYVLFTSGSTGRPKGVAVQHSNYLNYFQSILPRLEIAPGMHFAMVSTFSTDLGTIQFWAPLTTGGVTHIVAYERATDPEALVAYFRQHRIDVLKLVPSHYEALQSIPDADAIVPRHLVIFTGEPSHWETVARVKQLNPACMVQDHYGVTETTCATLVKVVPDEIPADRAATLPLGYPIGNVRVYTLDEHLQPTPPGVPGELCIGGLGVTRGYFMRPALTAERFVPDPFSSDPGARMYRTGDLAFFRSDGSLKLLGRMDFQIKIRGYRIEAGEIETLLCEQPAVQDAVVLAREDTPGDKRLVAYVVPQPQSGDDLNIGALREVLRRRLPDYMVPTAFVTLEAVPLNPNGKVDRFKLPAPEYTRVESGVEMVEPRTPLEEQIAAAWREILGVEKLSIYDNFFDVGGESFKAIRVVRKIGSGVSVMDLFKYPTIAELAEQLSDEGNQSTGLLYELTKPLSAAQKKLSLVCVPYGGGSAIVYRPLAEALPPGIALYALQIPGHDFSRPDEPARPIEEVAQECVAEIQRDLSGPVAVYGHCVGAALALAIARRLEEVGVPLKGVYLAGAFPTPRMPGKFFELWNRIFPAERRQSNRRLYEGLRVLGGFSEEMAPEEVEFAVNSMRHDMREAEDFYTASDQSPEMAQIKAPILCVVGEADRATDLYQERYRNWETYSQQVELAVIPKAGHYFLKHQATELAEIVAEQRAVWQGERSTVRDTTSVAPRPRVAPNLLSFFVVTLGQFVSMLGSGLTTFALSIWIFQQTGDLAILANMQFFAFLPGILMLPVAGAVADRWDKRKVMIISDLVAAASTLALIILVASDQLLIWHLYVIGCVSSIAGAFQIPAYLAAITQLVPKQYLGRANGLIQFTGAASNILAPMLGAALVVLIGLPPIIGIDLLTCLLAVGGLLLIKIPDTLFFREEEPLFQALTGGWRFIVRRPSFMAMVLFFTVFNYLVSLIIVLRTPIALTLASEAFVGLAMTMNAVGSLLGGFVMGVWGGTRRRVDGMLGFAAVYGLGTMLVGLRPEPIFFLIGLFTTGMTISLLNAHWLALIQNKVGLELQGRVMAMNQMLGWAMMPLGFLTVTPIVTHVFNPLLAGPLGASLHTVIGAGPGRDMGLLALVAGLLITLLSLLALRYRPLRFMEEILPDAIPDAVVITDKDALQALIDQQQLPVAKK